MDNCNLGENFESKTKYLKEWFVFHKIECIEDIEVVLFSKDKGVAYEGIERGDCGDMVVGISCSELIVFWVVDDCRR